jgi:hypothetical protein
MFFRCGHGVLPGGGDGQRGREGPDGAAQDHPQKAGIQAGDKLVLIGWEKDGQMCCITMVKADSLAGMVKGMLGPMMKDIMAS